MRSVLIVSPRFPPTSAPDHQRVRMMLPGLAERGWHAVILAVEPRLIEAPIEPDLLRTIPDDVEIVRTGAISQKLTRRIGFGSLSLRALSAIRRAGDHLLASRQFDLVFFSTTEFGVISLGLRWKHRFGVPFVVDLQDPWVNTYYGQKQIPPPGGAFKHGVTQAIARRQEGRTLREAAHIISVSPRYADQLSERYPGLRKSDFSVIPFAASEHDFHVAEASASNGSFFSPDGRSHWLYAGTAPPGIRRAVTALLMAFKKASLAGIVDSGGIQFHFIGTDYAPAEDARPRVKPIAQEIGLASIIDEHPARIPFLETLRCLRMADALLVLGWDDPGYTASKIYPYILANRPLLSVLHESSSANDVILKTGAGVAVSFNSNTSVEHLANEIFEKWFVTRAFERQPTTSWSAFSPYTAESMTNRVAAVFDRVVNSGKSPR